MHRLQQVSLCHLLHAKSAPESQRPLRVWTDETRSNRIRSVDVSLNSAERRYVHARSQWSDLSSQLLAAEGERAVSVLETLARQRSSYQKPAPSQILAAAQSAAATVS